MNYKKLSRIIDMANVRKSRTGLDNDIYISMAVPGHQPRIKVYENLAGPNNPTISVGIEPPHKKLAGEKDLVSNESLKKVRAWLDLNHDLLIDFWDGKYPYQDEFIKLLKKI